MRPDEGVVVVRQIWITRAGPPEVLQVKEAADPAPNAGEVRVRVEASGGQFRRHHGAHGHISRFTADSGCAWLRSQRSNRRCRLWHRPELDRPRRNCHDPLWRICRRGLLAGEANLPATGRTVGTRGRRNSGKLLYRLAACRGHGSAQSQRDRTYPFSGGRGWRRRDPDREARRGACDRHGIGRQA
jgi:hypothetical protein